MNNIYVKNRYSHGHIQSCECDPSRGYVCIDLHIVYCVDQNELRHDKRLRSQAKNCSYVSKLSLVAEMHSCRKEKLMLSLVLV